MANNFGYSYSQEKLFHKIFMFAEVYNRIFPPEVFDRLERDIFYAGIKKWDIKINKQINQII